MLPGRLTTEHIEKAIARGDGYIQYRGIVYTITELRELDEVGRQRDEGLSEQHSDGEKPDDKTDQDRAGSLGKRSNKAYAKKAQERQELTEIDSGVTPE